MSIIKLKNQLYIMMLLTDKFNDTYSKNSDSINKFNQMINVSNPKNVRVYAALSRKKLPEWMLKDHYRMDHPRYLYQCSVYQRLLETQYKDTENLVILLKIHSIRKDVLSIIRNFLSPRDNISLINSALSLLPHI